VSAVAEDKDEITDADGPLIQAALRRAKDVDDAATPEQRRKGWLRLLATGAVAFAEGWLRDTFRWGVVLSSIVAIGVGVTAGRLAWTVVLIVAGVAGTALMFWSLARRWSFGRQWAVLLGALVVQIALIAAQLVTA
jgi:hypothetical protein